MLLADVTTLSIVYWIAAAACDYLGQHHRPGYYLELYPCIIVLIAALVSQGLYPALLIHPAEEIRRTFVCVAMMLLLIGATVFLRHGFEGYASQVFLASWALSAPALLFGRMIARHIFSHRDWWGIPAVVLAPATGASQMVRSLRHSHSGLRITGVLTDDHFQPWAEDLPPMLGGLAYAPHIANAKIAQYAIIAIPAHSGIDIRRIIQDYCKGFRHVLLVPDLPGLCGLGITAREIGGEIGFEVPQRLFHPSTALFKRFLDVTVSLFILAGLSGMFLLLSILIKLSSKGPVFFRHKRYGRNASVFEAFKFRTMVQNGDDVLKAHFIDHPEDLEEWRRDHKLKEDPRVGTVGKWLRRYSLDELPQLFNVVMGEMSLVGPRPIIQDEIRRYGAGYDLYTRVLPGITGLWQVSGRNNTTYEERVSLDKYYVRNWSIWLDAYILARTIKTVVTAHGAY